MISKLYPPPPKVASIYFFPGITAIYESTCGKSTGKWNGVVSIIGRVIVTFRHVPCRYFSHNCHLQISLNIPITYRCHPVLLYFSHNYFASNFFTVCIPQLFAPDFKVVSRSDNDQLILYFGIYQHLARQYESTLSIQLYVCCIRVNLSS